MDWTAKLDQQRDALMRVFYMFVFMTLLVIRTGLEARCAAGYRAFSSSFGNPHDPFASPDDDAFPGAPPWDHAQAHADHQQRSAPLACQLDQLYAEALALLHAAEIVARRLAAMAREIFELMNAAHAQSARGWPVKNLDHTCGWAQRRARQNLPRALHGLHDDDDAGNDGKTASFQWPDGIKSGRGNDRSCAEVKGRAAV